MKVINGTIINAGVPSDPTGTYAVRYQDITIIGASGKTCVGRIGSKNGYNVGDQVEVSVEEKNGQKGPYNYFKKHNPQYDGQGGSSGGQSGGRDYDKENHGKCFTNLLGAVMGTYALSGKWPNEADYIHLADLATVCMNSYDYRTTGTQPATEPPAGEDIPF